MVAVIRTVVVLSLLSVISFVSATTLETTERSSCGSHGPCPDGKVCAGNARRKQCVKPMPEGGACKEDPFWVCAAELECRNRVCKPPMGIMGARCDKPSAECKPGTVCAGTDKVKKCVKPMPEGGLCKGDPYWVCAAGLECRDRVCKKPMGQMGARCDKPGVKCMPGTVCAGTRRVKKCVKPMPEGGFCKGDPYWVCAAGLICKGRVCVKPRMPRMAPGPRCESPEVVCPPGTKCVGNAVKRCTKPMKEGQECRRDPFWFCDVGLECRDRKCQKPFAKPGGRCENAECPPGQTCAGIAVKRCIVPMGPGGECRNDPFWICADGLFCKDNVCTYMVEEMGRCEKKGAMCVEGTRCVGTQRKKKCKKPMQLGGICNRKDPFWFCDEGLMCKGGKCVVADSPPLGMPGVWGN